MGWEKGVMFVNLDGESLFEGLVNIDSNHDELLRAFLFLPLAV